MSQVSNSIKFCKCHEPWRFMITHKRQKQGSVQINQVSVSKHRRAYGHVEEKL